MSLQALNHPCLQMVLLNSAPTGLELLNLLLTLWLWLLLSAVAGGLYQLGVSWHMWYQARRRTRPLSTYIVVAEVKPSTCGSPVRFPPSGSSAFLVQFGTIPPAITFSISVLRASRHLAVYGGSMYSDVTLIAKPSHLPAFQMWAVLLTSSVFELEGIPHLKLQRMGRKLEIVLNFVLCTIVLLIYSTKAQGRLCLYRVLFPVLFN